MVIRKNADDLSDWVDRAAKAYRYYGATIAYRPPIIKFPSGAIIRTGHLKDDQAYTKYQGHEYHRMLIEELTQIPDEKRYLQLVASCRSTVSGLDARVFATTNPGGVGHGWVKRRFVDPSPPNIKFLDLSSGRSRVFIPAKVEDTPQLVKNDPGYIQFLEGLKSTDVELWKAWRLGDWDTFAGQFFKEFRRDLHVCRPFIPDKNNVIVGGMDWGRTAPYSFHLAEISPQQTQDGEKYYRAKTFLEAYGTDKTPKEWADVIKEKLKFFKLKLDDITWIQGDPAMFTKGNDGSISIADQFRREGVLIKPGSNDRVGGWENLHNWLSLAPDELPYWQITENCTELIRTLPELVHDENKVEDVDTQSEDHACFCRHTEILTKRGVVPIIKVRIGDYVWTPVGWSKVTQTHKVGTRPLYTFLRMKSTRRHPYLTQDGFRPLIDLKEMDKLWSVFTFSDGRTADTQILQDIPIRSIFAVVQRRNQAILDQYISMSGNTLKEKLLQIPISIIRMGITIETILKILRWSLIPNMLNDIKRLARQPLGGILRLLDLMPWLGTNPWRVKSSIVNLQRHHGLTKERIRENATFVKKHIKHISQELPNSAALTAKCPCLDVDMVYSLTTDSGMFTAGYVVVSNSDDQRYMFKALKWIGVKVGGYSHATPRSQTVRKTAEFINVDGEQKQRSINLNKFAQPNKIDRDKRVGAVRRT